MLKSKFPIFLYCSLLIAYCLLSVSGCKEKAPKEDGQKELSVKGEDFSKMRAYVSADNKFYIINLEKNIVDRARVFPDMRDMFLSGGTIWIAGDSLCRLSDGEIEFGSWLPDDYKKVILEENKIYVLKRDEILKIPSERMIALPELPIKFTVGFGRIWILDQEGFSIYRTSDFKEEHRIPSESPLDFALSRYGLRGYIGRFNCLDVFDTQGGNYITSIPINGFPRALEFMPSGDKLYCLTGANLYVIKRSTNRIEHRLELSDGKDIWFSRNGEYGAVLRDSIISFFNTKTDKIVKSLKLEVIDITTSLGDSRVYCLTPEGVVLINPEKFETLVRIKLAGGKKIIIK